MTDRSAQYAHDPVEDGEPYPPAGYPDTRDHQVATLQTTVEVQKRNLDMIKRELKIAETQVELLNAEVTHWRAEAADLAGQVVDLHNRLADADAERNREPEPRRGVVRCVWDLLSRTRTRDL